VALNIKRYKKIHGNVFASINFFFNVDSGNMAKRLYPTHNISAKKYVNKVIRITAAMLRTNPVRIISRMARNP